MTVLHAGGKFGGRGSGIAGGHGVHHDDVAAVEQGGGIVLHAIGRSRHEAIRLEHHPFGPERAHVQPDRRRSRSTVERKRQRTPARILPVECVGDEEHLSFDLAVAALNRKPSRRRRVTKRLSVDRHLVMCDHGRDLGHVVVLVLIFVFIGGLG